MPDLCGIHFSCRESTLRCKNLEIRNEKPCTWRHVVIFDGKLEGWNWIWYFISRNSINLFGLHHVLFGFSLFTEQWRSLKYTPPFSFAVTIICYSFNPSSDTHSEKMRVHWNVFYCIVKLYWTFDENTKSCHWIKLKTLIFFRYWLTKSTVSCVFLSTLKLWNICNNRTKCEGYILTFYGLEKPFTFGSVVDFVLCLWFCEFLHDEIVSNFQTLSLFHHFR